MTSPDMSTMVAVASGSRAQIRRWETSLRRASIEFYVAEPMELPASAAGFRAEVWVVQKDAEKARAILRQSCVKDELSMW